MKKILSVALCALVLGGVSSCKDYEDEIRADHKQDIAVVSADITALKGSVTALQTELAVLKSQCDADHARIAEIEKTLVALQAELDKKANQEDVDAMKQELLAQIAAVDSIAKANSLDIVALKDTVAQMSDTLKAAVANLNALQDMVTRQITSIVMQTITSPALGDISINIGGVKSTLLCAYYGKNIAGTDEFYGLDLTKSKMLSNAGDIYFTLNPLGNDFTAAHVKLIKSNSTLAPVELTAAVPETEFEVAAGISRADQVVLWKSTAFYKSVKDAEANEIKYEEELKNVAKDIKTLVKEKKASGVKTLLKDVLMAAIRNSDCPAYALAADYYDTNEQTKTVMSDLNIAVKAVKPLAFTLDVKGALGNPNLHRSIPAIKEMLDKLEGKLDMGGAIGEVELKFTLEDNHFVAVDMYNDIAGLGYLHWDKVYLDLDWYGDEGFSHALAAAINKGLNAPDGLVAQIETAINNKITSVIGSAQNSKPVHAADKMISFLNKTIEFLATKVDNVNYYMEPVMFWGNKDAGYHHLSSLKSAPTYVNGSSMDFYATTYTADVLNPAFKKAIVVKNLTTNAIVTKGYDVSKNGSKSLTINKAFDGGVREVSVVFPASGLYEITYAAIDYHGNVVEIPYYVNVTL